jgi:hypothetical protein
MFDDIVSQQVEIANCVLKLLDEAVKVETQINQEFDKTYEAANPDDPPNPSE